MRALWLACMLLLPFLAQADFKSDYSEGVKAVERGNWARAKEKLQSAIAKEPTPKDRVRLYGMRLEPYIPQFYLGVALANLRECSGALQNLKNSASQQILASVADLQAQRTQASKLIARCEGASTPGTPTTLPTPPVVPIGPSAPVVAPIDRQQVANAQADLARLRQRIESKRADLNAVDSNSLQRITQALAASEASIQRALKDNSSDALASAKSALASQQVELLALERRAAALAARAPAATPAVVTPPAAPIARPVAPIALTQIAEHFFAGRLTDAARADLTSLSGKSLAHALQLRAAARYAIYSQQGAQNAGQLASVSQDLRDAKAADSSIKPSARFFSPKLIALYAQL